MGDKQLSHDISHLRCEIYPIARRLECRPIARLKIRVKVNRCNVLRSSIIGYYNVRFPFREDHLERVIIRRRKRIDCEMLIAIILYVYTFYRCSRREENIACLNVSRS